MKKNYDEEDERSTSYRVRLLRNDRGWNQSELADKLFVSHSQISRLESGETQNINSSMLVAMAQLFHVSTDYLLGLTPISVPKSYDISELGLSEEVVKRLITGTIDANVVNRLLEHKDFPHLCAMMHNYFEGTIADGIMARNAIIDLATEPLAELISSNPANKSEIIRTRSFLNSQKIAPSEADIDKIKNMLLRIIVDIKKSMETKEPTGAIATKEAVEGIRAALPDKPMNELTADDVAKAVTAYVGKAVPMDDASAALLNQLMSQLLVPASVDEHDNK